jgi:hypothetical protein
VAPQWKIETTDSLRAGVEESHATKLLHVSAILGHPQATVLLKLLHCTSSKVKLFKCCSIFVAQKHIIYRMSQEERTIFWKLIVSVILSKKLYVYMCPIPNGFRDRAITLYTVHTNNTSCPHTNCKVH